MDHVMLESFCKKLQHCPNHCNLAFHFVPSYMNDATGQADDCMFELLVLLPHPLKLSVPKLYRSSLHVPIGRSAGLCEANDFLRSKELLEFRLLQDE